MLCARFRAPTVSHPSYARSPQIVFQRQYDFWNELRTFSITFGMMMFICTCYYFLLCREWWCHSRYFWRLQYF